MNAVQTYLDNLAGELQTGQAREHSYRPALKTLLETFGNDTKAINEPKRSEVGAPDFIIERGDVPIGILEAKDIDVPLDKVAASEQMTRYLKIPNVILTDYLEFRWYDDGDYQQTVRIGQVENGRIIADPAAFPKLETLLKNYMQNVTPTVTHAEDLATRMADLAQLIRDYITADMQSDDPSQQLTDRMEAFKKTLLPDIDRESFADMYAQTIAYGMFVARVYYTDDGTTFRRQGAAEYIPQTNPFLRRLFDSIKFDVGERVNWVVDKLADLLAHTDTDTILANFGQATRQEDPVVHFYEDFLHAYDPQKREQRGVYYTPEPVVSYIVRSVDHILRDTFGKNGLAADDVMILDPATGTGTFLYFVIEEIRRQMQQYSAAWDNYVQTKLLPRIFGFELMMAPYTVAHMKLGLQLREMGYNFPQNERLGIYLTNTLEEAVKQEEVLWAQFIADEVNEAVDIKREKEIMVVLGNPPYSNHGQLNKGKWISRQMKDWKPKKEKKWNPDDYMKFMRFSQWRIEQTGRGILAFVVNHSFLEGITHRTMRESLMQTFTDIYVLDLHGNINTGEIAPDGMPDKNVFDIKAGVCIVIFVKDPNKTGMAKIHHADLWGTREHKYHWLLDSDVSDTPWQTLTNVEHESCLGKFYFFAPKGFANIGEYCRGWSIQDIFPLNQNGIKTDRDDLFVGWDRDKLDQRIKKFYSSSGLSAKFIDEYRVYNTSSYNILGKREDTEYSAEHITRLHYRPLDFRWVYYNPEVISRAGWNVMQHMYQKENLALLSSRMVYGSDTWQDVQVTDKVTEFGIMASRPGNSAPVFPLYEYLSSDDIEEINQEIEKAKKEPRPQLLGDMTDQVDRDMLFPPSEKGRRPNLDKAFVQHITQQLGRRFIYDDIETAVGTGDDAPTVTPEAIFHYAYAVFHSPAYRERYAEFLKIDFPRLPVTSDAALFDALAEKGAALVQLHLLRGGKLATEVGFTNDPGTQSSMKVISRHPRYDEANQRVYINKTTYFSNVPPAVWEFHIGGYQVLHKWLKDRKKRELSIDEVQHYAQVVAALQQTMRLMDEIDTLIPGWPLS